MTSRTSQSVNCSLHGRRVSDAPLINRSVSFVDVTIYEFPLRIGDNPACTAGCPIALASKHQSIRKSSISSDDEDVTRTTETSMTKRRSRDLVIPSDIRTKLLLEQGYDLQRIVKTTEAILKIQEQRRESLQKTSWEGVKSFFQASGSGKTTFKMPLTINRASATMA
ncbi:hypothetical protein IV203_025436 [Nitzschia inconspicua]|uniref:Uncharacterized protein n=1 Tax=Nitzschia inconspicua TaxID=303405 RepID=A0A9K3LI50_9STRA|nr:hypothetical protein IV203_028218 [Nitzschia inconspicua]KAG7362552.1 hypothetical protein IV203_025436 [Nitzschia inconspicua]